MPKDRYLKSVTIANGTSLSGAINVNANSVVGLIMPTGWDAASITFAAALADGSTFAKVQNEAGTEKTVTSPAASVYIHFDTPLTGIGWLKIRSGTAASPVNQTADRAITVVIARSD